MDKDFWHQRWQSGQIGFHGQSPHWALEQHWHELNLPTDEPVLVPLCGKSLDMRRLRQYGHPVEGVELDPIAVQAFFDEWRTEGSLETKPAKAASWVAADGVRLWRMDFFDFRPVQPLRAFYDRAALIALPADMRTGYLRHLRGCLDSGASGLLVALEYDQNQKAGPPFSVQYEEIKGNAQFSATLLQRRDILLDSPKFRDQGVSSLVETVYWLQAV